MKNLEPRRARWMRVRLGILVALLGTASSRLVAAAYDLQVRQGPNLRDQASAQYNRQVEISPRRGTIYDRHHNPLAVSVASPSLSANPRRIAAIRHLDVHSLAQRLAGDLSLPVADVLDRLQGNRGFVWIKRNLSATESDAVAATMHDYHLHDRDGLEVIEESRRWYPNRELAAHVLGFVGSEGHGLEGIESSLDEQLRGRTLEVQGLRDARGNMVYAEGLTPGAGQAGDDVTLTLDSTIQFIVQRELAETCEVFEARGGSVIVTDPATGEILAMASYPTYNPNEFSSADPESRRDRAVTDRFEPGSTMKVFSVSGALEAGVVQPGQLINCYGGTYSIGDLTIHDAHPETWLTVMQVLARSSNIGAAQIGAALGSDGLERAYRRFGFGERTGLPLPGEARARFGDRRWYEVEVATVSFGQGIGVTAVQMAQGLGAVANGGRLVHPLLVSRVTDATGALVEEDAPDPGRPAMTPSVAHLMSEMLTTVTEEGGTGIEAAIPGVRVAGKTGTAQKANEHGRGYDDTRWTSSFIGFAPAQHPRLVVTVVIDEPQVAHAGGTVAAPLFRRVMEQSLRYLGELPASGRNVDLPARPSIARDRAATEEVGTHGAVSVAPSAGVQGRGTVPSVVSLTASTALQRLNAAGLDAAFVGTGRVLRQVPAAGEPSPPDRQVTVYMAPGDTLDAPTDPSP